MTPLAAILIAASAALHATWHSFTKKSGASLAFIASLATIGMLWSFPVRFFVGNVVVEDFLCKGS